MNNLCGAQNKATFTEILNQGRLPHESSISFEGTFNEYYFNDEAPLLKEICYTKLSIAESTDPITKNQEKFISVSLHSVFDGLNHREPLNLLVILDISGSMSGRFPGRSNENTKMKIANEILVEIVKFLNPDENLGIILFDNETRVLQSLKKISKMDTDELCKKILEISPRGGTNMELGMETGVLLMKDFLEINKHANQNNRIIFLTDAMPNIGGGQKSLKTLSNQASIDKIYTTYIGVGLDFDTKLVEQLTKIPGSNYFSVHSQKDFQKILNNDFNYIVTNTVLESYLLIESEEYEIDKAYGTPFTEETTNNTIKLGSQTASDLNEAGTKGGMILIKLKERKLKSKLNPSPVIDVTLFYETLLGKKMQKTTKIEFDQKGFENSAIQKLILLTKFVEIAKSTLIKKQSQTFEEKDEIGLKCFIQHFTEQMEALDDKKLERELESLNQLKYNNKGEKKSIFY
jgi:Ca-activated chloride channel homolog